MNSSTETNSVVTQSDLQAFASYMNKVWMMGNIICEAIAIPLSFVSCFAIVIVLCRVKEGVAVSAKIYYISLAIMDFFAIFGYHFLLSFLCENLYYFTNGEWYVPVEMSDPMCRIITFMMRQSEHTANWLYFALCAEKYVAVSQPMKARSLFTKRWSLKVVAVCVLTAIPVDVLACMAFGSVYYPIWGIAYCTSLDYYSGSFLIFIRLYISITIYFLPSLCTLAISFLLIKCIFSQARQRKHLTKESSSESTAGLNGAITVLIMAGIHCLVYMPLGVLSVWATASVLTTTSYVTYAVTYTYWLFLNISGLAHFPNIFIYATRIPAFRAVLFCQNNPKKA